MDSRESPAGEECDTTPMQDRPLRVGIGAEATSRKTCVRKFPPALQLSIKRLGDEESQRACIVRMRKASSGQEQ